MTNCIHKKPNAATDKRDIAIDAFFTQKWYYVGVPKLDYTDLIFIDSGVKMNGIYYYDFNSARQFLTLTFQKVMQKYA